MAKSEKIRGSALTRIFQELINYRTLLKMKPLNADDNQLTRINALADRNHEPHFIIDTPEAFGHAAAGAAPWPVRFEFTGRDHIQYGFTAVDGEILGSRTFVKMPRVVERNQRRKLFRIDAPAGTKLCLTLDGSRTDLEVINLSIGGSLAALVQTNRHPKESQLLVDNYFLQQAELIFPAEITQPSIRISAIQIKRLKMNKKTKRYEVALEFFEMDKGEQQKLTDFIYRLQRQHLRKRLPLDI